jgi:hypothetical protein
MTVPASPLVLLVDDFSDALEMYAEYLTFRGLRVAEGRLVFFATAAIGAFAVALVATIPDARLNAQAEPLRIYDLGRVCLYAVDTAGVWATAKNAIGLADSDPCPRERR